MQLQVEEELQEEVPPRNLLVVLLLPLQDLLPRPRKQLPPNQKEENQPRLLVTKMLRLNWNLRRIQSFPRN